MIVPSRFVKIAYPIHFLPFLPPLFSLLFFARCRHSPPVQLLCTVQDILKFSSYTMSDATSSGSGQVEVATAILTALGPILCRCRSIISLGDFTKTELKHLVRTNRVPILHLLGRLNPSHRNAIFKPLTCSWLRSVRQSIWVW